MNTPSVDTVSMVHNIINKYLSADDFAMHAGTNWYSDAHIFAESLGGEEDTYTFSGVIAALSPLTPWERNVQLATLVAFGVDPMELPTLGNSRKAVKRIMAGEDWTNVLNGLKTRAFASGIWNKGAGEDVCVDVHTKDVAYGIPFSGTGRKRPVTNKVLNLTEYREIANAYLRAADKVGIGPQTLQAIVWTAQCGKAA